MEEIKPITESKVETIKGREYDVQTIKRPRYTEEEKSSFEAEYKTAVDNMEMWANKASELKEKIDKF